MSLHDHQDDTTWAIPLVVLSSVLKMSLLIGVGIRLELNGFLDNNKRKCLSALAMEVCLPCLMFASVLPEASVTLLWHGWELLLFPVVYVCVGAALGILCCLAVGTPIRHLGAAAACAAFPNVSSFPVPIVSALGTAIPVSPDGFSALVYLSLVQITDGLLKYTIGPAVLRRDRRAATRPGADERQAPHLALGASMRSLSFIEESTTDFGLKLEQVRKVKPEWGRQKSYQVFQGLVGLGDTDDVDGWDEEQPIVTRRSSPRLLGRAASKPAACLLDDDRKQPLMGCEPPEPHALPRRSMRDVLSDAGALLREVCPPQVMAVLVALAIGAGSPWMKGLFLGTGKDFHILGFLYGATKQLGAGFVPLQMLSLGGRLVGISGDKGPLAKKGESGPDGPGKLWKISVTVLCARMVVTPIVLYGIARAANATLLNGGRPLAWWLPGLIVGSCPTANNMSAMADMVGAGRSISAATTALQLILSPLILTVTLSFIITKAQHHLACDYYM